MNAAFFSVTHPICGPKFGKLTIANKEQFLEIQKGAKDYGIDPEQIDPVLSFYEKEPVFKLNPFNTFNELIKIANVGISLAIDKVLDTLQKDKVAPHYAAILYEYRNEKKADEALKKMDPYHEAEAEFHEPRFFKIAPAKILQLIESRFLMESRIDSLKGGMKKDLVNALTLGLSSQLSKGKK